jgi:NADPH:quinone reductase-like Zn-dependent oxidoreductase
LDAFDVIKAGGKIVSVAGPLDERSAQMFGMSDYRLPVDFVTRCSEKKATYAFIFMHPNGAHLNEITELVEGGSIRPIVDHVYPFSKAIDAFVKLASGRAKGKIIVRM